jgi:hypothetical protein
MKTIPLALLQSDFLGRLCATTHVPVLNPCRHERFIVLVHLFSLLTGHSRALVPGHGPRIATVVRLGTVVLRPQPSPTIPPLASKGPS